MRAVRRPQPLIVSISWPGVLASPVLWGVNMWLGLSVVATGLGMIGLGLYGGWMGVQSREWPKVTGVITRARVRYAGGVVYTPEVRYVYTVNAIEHEGHAVSNFGKPFIGSKKAEEYLAHLVGDGKVPVFYDPNNPRRALLETGSSWLGTIGLAISGIPCVILGVIFMVGAGGG